MANSWRLKFLHAFKECLETEEKSPKEQSAFWAKQERELEELIIAGKRRRALR